MDGLTDLVSTCEWALAWLMMPSKREEIRMAFTEYLGEYAESQTLKDICLDFINEGGGSDG